MPSQLQWKSGYEGMPVYVDAHFWNLTQCLPSPGFCVFMMLGQRGGEYGYGDRGGLGPALRQRFLLVSCVLGA